MPCLFEVNTCKCKPTFLERALASKATDRASARALAIVASASPENTQNYIYNY